MGSGRLGELDPGVGVAAVAIDVFCKVLLVEQNA